MDLSDWMTRAHVRLDRDLARCIDAPESARLTGADSKALRQLARYLAARERVLFPALLAISPDDAARLAGHHECLRRCVVNGLRRMRAEPGAAATLRPLRAALAELAVLERAPLRAIFSRSERSEIAGHMRLVMMERKGGQRLRQTAEWLRGRLHRWLGLRPRRMLPTLRSAVFAYRG